ncbi:MAG: hypothetical protein COU11_01495 [Candidatus Harrisonbacteria bacterium CG10_big_fil_rev_8_21_14_0_10_49_15]|uniref:Cohesin domain-containing protein n=1 Tax=Candidatus Harrisonbacteria bacterium CG10_big_fil_rev_8_21_14_0_10_49_15 TaxID=1974587 RepID=A0A2H0ULE4_9BACT|nr:MAG: hypothetical protein COU11_01495 [Candidatus Harrisonbacteria bacterium CG10_big_fil_rev_8_21_14_0_10_49_15]
MGPATGTFTVGSTFTVSFYVDTGNEFINAVETKILFPPDKLQVVSPSTGASFINVWAIAPSHSNTEGTISFRGAVPSPGINTDAGLISTVTFRVKSVGRATIRFNDDSRVLRNDGLGTDILRQKQAGIYSMELPPPAGPVVSSETHPDQNSWSKEDTAILSWGGDAAASGYSYVLNNQPIDTPDNISEGAQTSVTYKKLTSGQYYFHVKALRNGIWGGVTHYAISVDREAPANFNLEFIPAARTSRHEPIFRFFTTDVQSGIDFYEMKIVGLNVDMALTSQEQQFFIEVESPYLPQSLPYGAYDVILRAHDKAGNVKEVISRLEIVKPLFRIVGDEGISFRESILIPWWIVWLVGIFILIFLGVIAYRFEEWHRMISHAKENKKLPGDVHDKLKELKEYQQRYGKIASAVLILVTGFSILFSGIAPARAASEFTPPSITEVSRNIFNDEIFYIGGQTGQPETEVVLYLQSQADGATLSQRLLSDADGNWFYRHPSFLQSGSYVLWAQASQDNELSPPSPQVAMNVASHAIQFGASRFSYSAIYLISLVFLLGIVIALAIIILHHYRHGRRKHKLFKEEIRTAEESIRRGFALLRRDLETEFAAVSRTKATRALSKEEEQREDQILRDLESVRRNIGEEVWELEKKEA